MAEAIRGRVSPYTFLNRFQQKQQQVENADTTVALRQNQLALLNVNNSLTRIAQQVSVLSASLQGIGNQIKETSVIDSLKEQQKARQERALAERQIREGKESQIEAKIQAALVTPLQKIGAKAQGSLFNLGRFFNILLGGFLLNRILKSVSELSENGQLSLKNLGDKIVKDLGIVGTIFLGINGGFGFVLSTLLRVTGLITRLATRNLILKPLDAMVEVIKNVLGKFKTALKSITLPNIGRAVTGAAGPIAKQAVPIAAGAGAMMQQGQQRPAPAPTRGGRSPGVPVPRLTAPLAAIINFFTGGSLGESLTAGALALAPRLLGLTGPYGFAASIGLPFLANIAYQQIAPTAESFIPQLGLKKDTLFQSLTQSAKNNTPKVSVVNLDGGTEGEQQNIPATLGDPTYLPAVTSSNPDNFYLMYSQIQYNVVG
jgi:hypothetical protein